MAEAMFGAGCFWGVEHAFRQVEGVTDVAVGYSGGATDSPTYKQVCRGDTGHAEVVHVTYDEDQIDYAKLLDVFFGCHDPTQKDRQGPDVGSQYRSAIFTYGDGQRKQAQAAAAALGPKVATQIEPAAAFHRAEEYHQRYFEKNGAHGCGL